MNGVNGVKGLQGVQGITTPRPHCLNCAEALLPREGGGPPLFCPACGQESNLQAPTLREFAQQFGGAYFSTEGALWRTLKLLLLKPGELTRRYLAGQRKHYVLPLRLYLTVSVLMLLVLRLTGSGVQIDIKPDAPAAFRAPDAKTTNFAIVVFGEGRGLGLRNGVFYCTELPAWLCKRAQRRIDIDPKAVAGEIEQFKERFLGNVGGAMFLLLPSFALWLKLVYLNRRLRYTEHLVFALHLHTYWFLAFGLVFTNVWWLTAMGCTAVPWYTMVALRRVYAGRRWPRFLRASLVTLLYAVVLTLVLTLVALWTLLF